MMEDALEIAQATRAAYSAHAELYSSQTRGFARYPGLEGELRDALSALPAGRVLDVGCGSGRDAELAERLGRQVVAADASFELLMRLPGLLKMRTVCCDVIRLPFRGRCFVGVIASGILLHLPKHSCQGALVEIARVLVPRGSAIISMKRGVGEGWRQSGDFPVPRWFAYYMPGEFADLCEGVGLVVSDLKVSHRKDWFTVYAARRG
jgi:tRNA (uracil-5-)-methyltransferase TRM9